MKTRFRILAVLLALTFTSYLHAQEAGPLASSKFYTTVKVRVLKKVPLPKGYHEGLFFDGGDIWVANGKNGKIWVIDSATGALKSHVEPPGGFTEGMTRSDDGMIFVTDWDDKKIYRVNREGNKLIPAAEALFDPAHPAGVVWADGRLFVITWTRGLGTKFDLIEMDGKMQALRKVAIQRIQEPSQMAWDGKYLWITSWYTRLVYKINVDTMEILSSFYSPVPLTTGIAWDGKNLWITGTHSDLYQLEVEEGRKGESMNLMVMSTAFKEGEMIPRQYTCDDKGFSPPLEWHNIPTGTKSIALISDDPDAPRGTWVHWVMFNIPPKDMGLAENVPALKILPNGARQGINDGGAIGYGSPCPPYGVHRYYFKVYALDTMLDPEAGNTKNDLLRSMKGHILAEGQLMGTYKR